MLCRIPRRPSRPTLATKTPCCEHTRAMPSKKAAPPSCVATSQLSNIENVPFDATHDNCVSTTVCIPFLRKAIHILGLITRVFEICHMPAQQDEEGTQAQQLKSSVVLLPQTIRVGELIAHDMPEVPHISIYGGTVPRGIGLVSLPNQHMALIVELFRVSRSPRQTLRSWS